MDMYACMDVCIYNVGIISLYILFRFYPVCMYVCMYACMYVFKYRLGCIRVDVCMYVCMYVYKRVCLL
jgi:hypothetical protein